MPFSMDVEEITREALERVQPGQQSGYDAKSARRLLNLLFLDFVNRGVNLFTVDEESQALVSGTSSYVLEAETVDILDAVIRRDSRDLSIDRIGYQDYLEITNKSQTGRPTQFLLERGSAALTLRLWPTPDNSTDTFRYWRVRYIAPVTGPSGTPDIPPRFLPATISGLAYMLARKKSYLGLDVRAALLQEYEAEFARAVEEDRDRSVFYAKPRLRRV